MSVAAYFLFLASNLSACQSTAHSSSIEIKSISKNFEGTISDREICNSFKITKKDVAKYFHAAKEVNASEFHGEAMILPCKYAGELTIQSKPHRWEIMAGGAGYLYSEQRVDKRFICKNTCCKNFKNLC